MLAQTDDGLRELKPTNQGNTSTMTQSNISRIEKSITTLKRIMAMPLNFPLSGKVIQSTSVIVPQLSKKLRISSSVE